MVGYWAELTAQEMAVKRDVMKAEVKAGMRDEVTDVTKAVLMVATRGIVKAAMRDERTVDSTASRMVGASVLPLAALSADRSAAQQAAPRVEWLVGHWAESTVAMRGDWKVVSMASPMAVTKAGLTAVA